MFAELVLTSAAWIFSRFLLCHCATCWPDNQRQTDSESCCSLQSCAVCLSVFASRNQHEDPLSFSVTSVSPSTSLKFIHCVWICASKCVWVCAHIMLEVYWLNSWCWLSVLSAGALQPSTGPLGRAFSPQSSLSNIYTHSYTHAHPDLLSLKLWPSEITQGDCRCTTTVKHDRKHRITALYL